GHAEEYGAETL
nr:Chain C, Hemoglobin subunit alpha-A [synthetic construct]